MSAPDLTKASWHKSSYSNGAGGECVEIAQIPGIVGIRDTKDRDGGSLACPATAWTAFLGQIRP
ncbi:DUF397 domain-containing protein [Amycolatopsis sp. H20-H5]|uniref:DUF397 domain-containing protein n=1 Tax=Amycolatopsis sp. H20-H5 TaxID=3046309 RepID=UPI002DB67475|nr:DUF397 domain-containing protein [Amycolatopsis sp. H20-H5]MEC3982612.1 DUF397 domain-containing protein [Amycolatopsis sp. H20-H5]